MNETAFEPWRKSSYSGDGDCVELAWRKSSRSAESNCVELAYADTTGAIRDSKNPDGGHLEVPLAGLLALAKNW
ncbi:DUF397 domain-containing protein [Actinophytocola sp. KF-1]